MKRTYECMVLLDNREVKRGWDELKATVAGLFDKHGAEVVSARRWDERRLTYSIKRQKRATFLLMYINADTPQVHAIRRDMEFSDPVLRNFITACEKIPEEAFEPEAAFDIAAIRVEDEAPQAAPPAREAKAEAEAPAKAEAEAPAKAEAEAPAKAEAEAPAEEGAGESKAEADAEPKAEAGEATAAVTEGAETPAPAAPEAPEADKKEGDS